MCVLFCLSICSHASVTWSHSCVAATLALLSCNFDKGLCNYTQDTNDDFDWTRQHGSTSSSNTGPRFDHTQNNLAGKCLSQQPWPCITHTHTYSLSLSLCHTHAYIHTHIHQHTSELKTKDTYNMLVLPGIKICHLQFVLCKPPLNCSWFLESAPDSLWNVHAHG